MSTMPFPHFILVVTLLTLCVATVCGQIDSCGSDLSMFLPSPFNSSGLSCRPIWNNFILRYAQDENKIMTIILSTVYTSGWVAIGFSDDGLMIGSNAIIGYISSDTRAHIDQYYLKSQIPSQIAPNTGHLQNTQSTPQVVLYGLNLYLAFQLNFSSSPLPPYLLFAVSGSTPSSRLLSEHDDKISILFDFSVKNPVSLTKVPKLPLKHKHGLLSTFSWGVILPIGAIVARYFKNKNDTWYYVHVFVQFAGFFFALAGLLLGIRLNTELHSDVPMHRGVGIFVFSLCILQALAFFIRPGKESRIRMYWNWYHHWVGRLALFLGSVNVVLGMRVGHANIFLKVGYGINVVVFVIASLILEIRRWVKKSVDHA